MAWFDGLTLGKRIASLSLCAKIVDGCPVFRDSLVNVGAVLKKFTWGNFPGCILRVKPPEKVALLLII